MYHWLGGTLVFVVAMLWLAVGAPMWLLGRLARR
jgi:hypothetical protein